MIGKASAPGGLLATDSPGRFRIDGALTIERVPAVLDSGTALLLAAAGGQVEVDLSGLEEFDSAALGVMFEWQRLLASGGCRIRYVNLPAKLATLARLYGVDSLLATAADA